MFGEKGIILNFQKSKLFNNRRIATIIETKIQYLLVKNKIYKVTDINFADLTLEAIETTLLVSDVPSEQLFDVMDFKEFRVRLRNRQGKIVDFAEFVRRKHPDFDV